MKKMRVSDYALRSFEASKLNSVVDVYYKKIQKVEDILSINGDAYYVGVKNTNVIPSQYLEKLEEEGFLVHTKDAMSERGRAVDYELLNPITGRFMSGSSSGTAINVFRGINDIGIGTDGGGSVLAPAIALNCYGFISPLICQKELSIYSKKSTDNITFSPSIGFISKELELINKILRVTMDLSKSKDLILTLSEPVNSHQDSIYDDLIKTIDSIDTIELSYDSSSRNSLMDSIRDFDFENRILMTFEGPVDLFEYGDSLLGHYNEFTKSKQERGNKYYLTVANMMGLSALIIPTSNLSTGILLLAKSDPLHISSMFKIAETIRFERSQLEENYFSYKNY